MHKLKILFLVILGNILEYYDFLLFAHIGYVITPLFIPAEYSEHSHLFSLFMFSLPFIIRPAGGWFFGRVADNSSLNKALDATLCYAAIASLVIAILPTYSVLGVIATALFILFRALQGFALGGEYTIAGSFLMDKFEDNKSLISGILGGSGTIGSIIAFGFASLYINYLGGSELWRLGFVFGAVATYVSYYSRKLHLGKFKAAPTAIIKDVDYNYSNLAIYKTLAIGALTSVSCFIPMVYSNYYLTKILALDTSFGLYATFISLILYIILTPLMGHITDRIGLNKFVFLGLLVTMPLIFIGFELILYGSLLGQVFLTLSASIVGANIHVIMNKLFPRENRSRNINFYFTLGASLGGILPVISGYINVHYGFLHTPLIVIEGLLLANLYLFTQYRNLYLAKAS